MFNPFKPKKIKMLKESIITTKRDRYNRIKGMLLANYGYAYGELTNRRMWTDEVVESDNGTTTYVINLYGDKDALYYFDFYIGLIDKYVTD